MNRHEKDSHSGSQATVNGRRVTSDEISFRDGYMRGRTDEERDRINAAQAHQVRQAQVQSKADNGAAVGLILGLLVAGLASVAGIYIYSVQDSNNPEATPEATSEVESEEGTTENSTTIIERTIERTQEVIPVPSEVSVPEVDINLPEGEATSGEQSESGGSESNAAPEASTSSEPSSQNVAPAGAEQSKGVESGEAVESGSESAQ